MYIINNNCLILGIVRNKIIGPRWESRLKVGPGPPNLHRPHDSYIWDDGELEGGKKERKLAWKRMSKDPNNQPQRSSPCVSGGELFLFSLTLIYCFDSCSCFSLFSIYAHNPWGLGRMMFLSCFSRFLSSFVGV